MLKLEGSNNCWKTENNSVIEWGNVYFWDIKEVLEKSSNEEEGCWKYH